MILKVILFIGILISASVGLIYTDKAMSVLGGVGLAQFVGLGKNKDKKNQFRIFILLGAVIISLFIFGGSNMRFGLVGLMCGILIIYYSRQIAQAAGNAIPSPSGMSANSVINIAGLIVTIVSILWLFGVFSPLTEGSVNVTP